MAPNSFDIDDESIREAERLFSWTADFVEGAVHRRSSRRPRLFGGITRYERPTAEEDLRAGYGALTSAQTADVVEALSRLTEDFRRYQSSGRCPIVHDFGEPIPVSLATVSAELGYQSSRDLPPDLRPLLNDWEKRPDDGVLRRVFSFNVSDAMNDWVRKPLTDFLTQRIAGFKFWVKSDVRKRPIVTRKLLNRQKAAPTNSPDGSGLFAVKVDNQRQGLRILVTPAYFIDWIYFGAPSTPTTNNLLPGRYIFGTDSFSSAYGPPHSGIISDKTIFRIPSDFNPQLMRF